MKTKEGMLRHLVVLEYYLGVPWASPSLGSCHSLFHSPSNLYPKIENFNHTKLNKNLREIRQYNKANHHSKYCCKPIHILLLHCIYCIPTFLWLIPPDTTHRFIKISEQRIDIICKKQNSLQQSGNFVYLCNSKNYKILVKK